MFAFDKIRIILTPADLPSKDTISGEILLQLFIGILISDEYYVNYIHQFSHLNINKKTN